MRFCKTCGSILMPQKGESGVTLFCKKCDTSEKSDSNIVLKSNIKAKDKVETVVITDRGEEAGSLHDIECPECETIRSCVQWQVQTRSADEAPTTFYRCTTCNHTFREYGG